MKSSTKRLLSLVIVLAMALSLMPLAVFAETPAILYVKPNSNWTQSNPRYAAYFFGAGEAWADCTDADGDGIYEVTIPAGGYTHIIFCRMNPNAAANNWNNKWNQTKDLPLSATSAEKNCYVVANNTWDSGNGEWVFYSPDTGAEETEPTTASPIEYSVAGEAPLCGSAWDPTDINNMMTDEDGDGIYTITYTAVAAGSYQSKVTDGSWSNCWGTPNSDANYTLVLVADADVTINFNTADKSIEVVSEGLDNSGQTDPTEPTAPSEPFVPGVRQYALVGYINGADYGCNDDYENVGQYIFVDGTLTTSFTADSYIFVKTTDNATWLLTEAYASAGPATFVVGGSEKLFVPGNVEVTFTLIENADGSVTVNYVTGGAVEPPVTEPSDPTVPAPATYYVAGTFNGWANPDANYVMTANSDGTYSLSINVTVGKLELKVTDGTWNDGGNWGDNGGNVVKNIISDGAVLVTFDPATGSVTVTGDCIEEEADPTPLEINSIHVAGSAGLLGVEWDPTANKMSADMGSYYITFENVPAGTYEFKFVANGAWDLNWASGVAIASGETQTAWKNAMGNSSIEVAVDGSTVTLYFDILSMDIYTGEGATMSALIETPEVETGVVVSGAVVSGAEGDVTVELIAEGETVASATATGKEGTYSIENVAEGTYTLKVSQVNHVTREYTITVGSDALTQDVKIHLIGDIDGNGKINVGDVSKLNSHLKGTNKLTDEYMILCANVNGGSLNMGDTASLYAHIKGTKLLY